MAEACLIFYVTGHIMEMHQIRYFLAVARTLNFTQAADECNVAQPSLSRAVRKLEEELGGELFRRERSLTHLTELGRIMLPLLTQAYETATSAKSLASSYRKGGYAALRIALSSTIDLRLLVGPLSSLMDAMPGLEMKFYRGAAADVAEHLKSGDFEIAIAGPLSAHWDRFRSYSLFNARFGLFAHRSHPLARHHTVTLAQLAGERIVTRPYCDVAEEMQRRLVESGVMPAASDVAASDHDVLALLDANVGVSILPTITPCGDNVHLVPITDLELECPIMLHTVIGRQHTPAASGLIQLLRTANWRERLPASDQHTGTDHRIGGNGFAHTEPLNG